MSDFIHFANFQFVLTSKLVISFFKLMDLFHLLSSPDVNWWTGVLWITCDVFISCLDSHSDGTHSLPLLRHWCRDTFLQIWWRNKLSFITDDLRMSTLSANVQSWVNYPCKGAQKLSIFSFLIKVINLLIFSPLFNEVIETLLWIFLFFLWWSKWE